MGRDDSAPSAARCRSSFNPRAPRGARQRPPCKRCHHRCFNPRAPRGARRQRGKKQKEEIQFQSTRPAWGATEGEEPTIAKVIVSIHAPRVGRDGYCGTAWSSCCRFNPRAPRGARRILLNTEMRDLMFQSTRPAWGATGVTGTTADGQQVFQSTRPAWGATVKAVSVPGETAVSIHAPRVGRDVRSS